MSQKSEGEELSEMTRAMAQGSDRAWESFHANYGPKIFRWLLSLTRGDASMADEALQRVYLRIARHVRVCANLAEFHAWLWSVVRSAAFDAQRSQFRFWKRQAQATAETETLENPPVMDDLDRRLGDALSALPVETAQLLRQKYFENKSVREISAQMGLSEKTIESRLTRARKSLRAEYLRFKTSEVS